MKGQFKLDAKWKRIVFFIAAVIGIIRIGYIFIGGQVDREYYTSYDYCLDDAAGTECKNVFQTFKTTRNRLNSIELIFNDIDDDNSGFIIMRILRSDKSLVYQTDISLNSINNNEWKKVFVNARLTPGEEYTIRLNAGKGCKEIPDILTVSGEAAPEAISSYEDDRPVNGQIAIRYGYLREPGFCDKIVPAAIVVLILSLIYLFLTYFEKICILKDHFMQTVFSSTGSCIASGVTQVILCMIIINCGKIEFSGFTKAVMYAVSVFSAVRSDDNKKVADRLADTGFKKTVLYGAYIYAAFALTGQRLFLFPLDSGFSFVNLCIFIVTVMWTAPVVRTVLALMELMCTHFFGDGNTLKKAVFASICVFLLVTPAIFNLCANNPGITSQDTYETMVTNVRELFGAYDWHPIFYSMILKVILSVWDSTYAVILVQYAFWIFVVLELIMYLRKKGIKQSVLLAYAFFTGINAANFMHLNTIWKDVPYAIALLWTLNVLVRLCVDHEEYRKKWYIYAELVISLFLVFMLRKNGTVTFAVIAVMLVLTFRKELSIWMSVAITLILVLIVKGPLYDSYGIQSSGSRGMYIGLGQDILGAYYAGGEVSDDTMGMINVMTKYNNAEYNYTPSWAEQSYDLYESPVDFILNYIDTYAKNPVSMTRAIFNRTDAMWDIFPGEGSDLRCVNFSGTMDHVSGYMGDDEKYYPWNSYYPEREFVSIYPSMSKATQYTEDSQVISAVVWRCGLLTLIGIIGCCFIILKGRMKKNFAILSPAIGHAVGLILSAGWSDFRYFWPLNLLNTAFILVIAVIGKEGNKSVKSKNSEN